MIQLSYIYKGVLHYLVRNEWLPSTSKSIPVDLQTPYATVDRFCKRDKNRASQSRSNGPYLYANSMMLMQEGGWFS